MDGLGRLERMLAKAGEWGPEIRHVLTNVGETESVGPIRGYREDLLLALALRSVAPELIQVARAAESFAMKQHRSVRTNTIWTQLQDALNALARKLDGLPEETP